MKLFLTKIADTHGHCMWKVLSVKYLSAEYDLTFKQGERWSSDTHFCVIDSTICFLADRNGYLSDGWKLSSEGNVWVKSLTLFLKNVKNNWILMGLSSTSPSISMQPIESTETALLEEAVQSHSGCPHRRCIQNQRGFSCTTVILCPSKSNFAIWTVAAKNNIEIPENESDGDALIGPHFHKPSKAWSAVQASLKQTSLNNQVCPRLLSESHKPFCSG